MNRPASWTKADVAASQLDRWFVAWGSLMEGLFGVVTFGLWAPDLSLRFALRKAQRDGQRTRRRREAAR